MEDKKLNRVFDRVRLSPEREEAMLADLLNEKREVSSMKQKRRIPAAALVAAVLVVALAGTAVATEYFERLDISHGDTGYDVTGAFQNIPPEWLSEEILERAAQVRAGHERSFFGSWSEAEEFLGIEVSDNPMLEEMARSKRTPLHEGDIEPEDARHCTADVSYSQGLPAFICLYEGYFGDYFEEGPFGVSVFAFMRVKTEAGEDRPFSVGMGNYEVINEETYVTPSGMDTTIITQVGDVLSRGGGSFQQHYYFAYFSRNNIMFQLITLFTEENADTTLKLLKEVLDAYE